MVSVTFIDHLGESRTVEAAVGDSLMQTAVRHRIRGIEAQCSGAMVCGTCHAYVQAPETAGLLPPEAGEVLMLSCGDHQGPMSRLTCQIRVTAALAGTVVRTPPSQP
jgi:ferredoxin, 2Fe-2S